MTKRTPPPFWWLDLWAEGYANGFRLMETMAAVPAVVNARMSIIGAVACNPLNGDWPELYRMVAEKAEAFTQSGLSLTGDIRAIQADILRSARSPRSAAASAPRIGRRAIGAAGRALAPVHAAAVGNAARLRAPR